MKIYLIETCFGRINLAELLKFAELTKYVGVVFRQLSTNFAANTLNVALTLLQGAIYKNGTSSAVRASVQSVEG